MRRIVVIGSSTGGPSALETFFKKIPSDFPVPILVAQHLTKPFTADLARCLDKCSKIKVMEATSGQTIENNNAYIIPGDSHFFIYQHKDKGFYTEPGIALIPADDLPKPSVDMGLTSTAEHYGSGTIAVILSGMGNDGVVGAKAVKQLLGRVIVQDEHSSAVWDMPKAVINAGYADKILPLGLIVTHLLKSLKD